MANHHPVLSVVVSVIAVLVATATPQGQNILPPEGPPFLFPEGVVAAQAEPLDPAEAPGPRPYEMVLAGRGPETNPFVDFDSLDGWTVEFEGGAWGALSVSVRQRIWESPVARLRYRGESEESRLVIRPPSPLTIPNDATAVTMWVFGNNWGWSPDPTTPQVKIRLLLADDMGKVEPLDFTQVRWKEWWLIHRVLPPGDRRPKHFLGMEITGAANAEERELYFENLTFFLEEFPPLSFKPRPKRGVDPIPGQSPGANVGPGRLPFPTRSTTILPTNSASNYSTQAIEGNGRMRFIYNGPDVVVEYCLQPGNEYWGPVLVKMNRDFVASALVGAGPTFAEEPASISLVSSRLEGEVAQAVWRVEVGGEMVEVGSSLRLWQKSLVVDFKCLGGSATGLSYGHLTHVRGSQLVQIPFLNYGNRLLNVLASGEIRPFFASVWMDWYLSNASRPFSVDEIREDGVHLNGGVNYLPKTNGERNDLFERFFVTFSPVFEETLPTIPNPPAWRGKEAGARLWQETWGPRSYSEEKERSRRLQSYGIEKLTQCNHEITWRDEGESFTFRTMAAPGKGGDSALKDFVAHQQSLGWRSGLYTNYTDFAPVNANWDIDRVMRGSDGTLIRAWPRCYSPKALFAVEADRILAPAIRTRYGSDAAYTDVHTAVSPWDRTDYDERVPGAGTFAATFYAYGDLLLHDQQVYDGFCWSEGNHQWLYAGLATGNYGLTYGEIKYREYPYLPHFDLLKMHPLSVDIGMPWTAFFFQGDEEWNRPENIERSIDRFLAATIAYGHLGWLVEETHGIRQTLRSYYMMQQLQQRYAMEAPEGILYGTDTGLVGTSEALLDGTWRRSRLFTRYRNGLEVWVNGGHDQNWTFDHAGQTIELPPFGWFASQGNEFVTASALLNGNRCDRIGSPDYVFLDGRGRLQYFQGLRSEGSVAAKRVPAGAAGATLELVVGDGTGEAWIEAPEGDYTWDDVRTVMQRVAAADELSWQTFGADGSGVSQGRGGGGVRREQAGWHFRIPPGTVRYLLTIPESEFELWLPDADR